MEENLQNYNKIKVIGHGSYGEVWLVKHKSDKKEYVLKKLDLRNASAKERRGAEQECRLLSQLKHPNIVTYKESFETSDGFLYISMRFCEAGDLYTKLKQQKGKLLEEKQIVEWFIQIAMALKYMHSQNIMHRDLKTQNIFLTKNKIIKVGDLGIARVLDSSGDMAKTLIGTPYYMSPEIFSNKPYNFKSDVWALGCCVFEMATLKHAFNGKDLNSLMYQIQRGRLPPMPDMYSVQLKSMIKAMMQRLPERRPSVERILKDSFVQKHITIFLRETRKSHETKKTHDKPTDRVNKKISRPTNSSKADKRRPSDEILKPLKCPPELEAIPEETGGQQSSSSLRHKGGGGGGGGDDDGDQVIVGGGDDCDDDKKMKEIEVEDHHHHQSKNISQETLPSISHSKSDPAISRQNRKLGVQRRSKVTLERSHSKEEMIERQLSNCDVTERSCEDDDDKREDVQAPTLTSSKSRPSSARNSRPLPHLRHHNIPHLHHHHSTSTNKTPVPIQSSLLPIQHHENPGHGFPSSSSSSSSSTSSSSSVSISPNVEKENLKSKNVEIPSIGDDDDDGVVDSSRLDTARRGARERRRQRVMNENLINIDVAKTKLMMSSQDNDRIKSLQDVSKRPTSSDKSSLERRNSDPDTKSKNSCFSTNLKFSDTPLSFDKQNVDKKIEGKRRKASVSDDEDDDDDLKTSPESETPEEVVEDGTFKKRDDRKEMKKFIHLLGTLTLRRRNDADGSDDDDDDEKNAIDDDEEVDDIQTFKHKKKSPKEPSRNITNERKEKLDRERPTDEGSDLSAEGMLYDRISLLRKDCAKGVGVVKLMKAFAILDRFNEEDIKTPLSDLLGQSDYDDYAGKIMQLKYYEENATRIGK